MSSETIFTRSVFPRFSYPDVNFWIWFEHVSITSWPVSHVLLRVFGKRYRDVVRGWEASVLSGGSNDKRRVTYLTLLLRENLLRIRINWAGTALNAFYAAVRKALVVVIVLRAIGILLSMGIGAWWLLRR